MTAKKEDELAQIKEMSKLKEEEIIKKALLMQLPWVIVGSLACFFPYVYAFVPAS